MSRFYTDPMLLFEKNARSGLLLTSKIFKYFNTLFVKLVSRFILRFKMFRLLI